MALLMPPGLVLLQWYLGGCRMVQYLVNRQAILHAGWYNPRDIVRDRPNRQRCICTSMPLSGGPRTSVSYRQLRYALNPKPQTCTKVLHPPALHCAQAHGISHRACPLSAYLCLGHGKPNSSPVHKSPSYPSH